MRVSRPSHGVALALTALAYSLCHHVGSLPDGLGPAGRGTRVADWIDLVTPLLVLTPALFTVLAARPGRATYLWFAFGSWLYVTGHGLHLSANSIGNVEPSETAHLWDEYVGHWTWYAGVAVLVAVLASTMRGRAVPSNPVAWLLAATVGITWGTNATGGEFTWAGLSLAVLAVGWGVRHRRDQGLLLAAAGAAGVVATVGSTLVR